MGYVNALVDVLKLCTLNIEKGVYTCDGRPTRIGQTSLTISNTGTI